MQALEVRVTALRQRGRRVVIAGDLNISPAPIDCCDPGDTSCCTLWPAPSNPPEHPSSHSRACRP